MDYVKMGRIMQSYGAANPKKYKVFLTNSIEALDGKELLGEADTYKEACKIIDEGVKAHDLHQEKYWRFLMGADATYIDFGSWSRFAAIVPPIPMDILTGKTEDI